MPWSQWERNIYHKICIELSSSLSFCIKIIFLEFECLESKFSIKIYEKVSEAKIQCTFWNCMQFFVYMYLWHFSGERIHSFYQIFKGHCDPSSLRTTGLENQHHWFGFRETYRRPLLMYIYIFFSKIAFTLWINY